MAWRIEFDPAAERELDKLDPQHRERIQKLLKRVAAIDDVRSLGDPLHGRLGQSWKYRAGSYRLICRIEDQQSAITVLRIGHRKEIYR